MAGTEPATEAELSAIERELASSIAKVAGAIALEVRDLLNGAGWSHHRIEAETRRIGELAADRVADLADRFLVLIRRETITVMVRELRAMIDKVESSLQAEEAADDGSRTGNAGGAGA